MKWMDKMLKKMQKETPISVDEYSILDYDILYYTDNSFIEADERMRGEISRIGFYMVTKTSYNLRDNLNTIEGLSLKQTNGFTDDHYVYELYMSVSNMVKYVIDNMNALDYITRSMVTIFKKLLRYANPEQTRELQRIGMDSYELSLHVDQEEQFDIDKLRCLSLINHDMKAYDYAGVDISRPCYYIYIEESAYHKISTLIPNKNTKIYAITTRDEKTPPTRAILLVLTHKGLLSFLDILKAPEHIHSDMKFEDFDMELRLAILKLEQDIE